MISISSDLQNIIDNNREKVPIGMIWVYDTTNTVPSTGPFVRYYSGIDYTLSSELKRTQFEGQIFNDWSNGIPAALSDYITVTTNVSGIVSSAPFSIYYSGYFYAETSGNYSFSVKVAGAVAIEVGGSSILTGGLPYSTTETAYATGFYIDKPQFWSGYKNLDTGWHDFKLYYQWDRKKIDQTIAAGPFLGAFWALSGQDPKVISASVLNYQPSFLQPTIIKDYIYIDHNVDSSLASTLSFEVPVTTSGSYSWEQQQEAWGYLKPNKLCKIFMGYVTQSGYDLTSGYTVNLDKCTDMVQKFTGFIDSAQISHTQSNSVLVVQCRDFQKKLLNALNENYPNKISYTKNIVDKIDPKKQYDLVNLTPMAWDRWWIKDVIETMALHGGIDPKNINKSKWDIQNHFVMESNLNWPKTYTVDYLGVQTKGSDPYIFTYPYGEKLQDQLKKVGDLIGYNIYFDEVGDLVFKEPRATNSVEVYEANGYGFSGLNYGDWSLSLEFEARNRLTLNSFNDSGIVASSGVIFSFSGVGCGIRYILFPSGSDYSINITRDSDLSVVYSSGFSTSGSLVKYNQVNEFTRNLPLDKYTASIYTTGLVRLESFEYYSNNPFRPARTLYDDRDITSVDMDLTDANLRNEVIGVGQQIGDKSYLYSKAIDLDSISNPAAFNYVGDKRTFVIIEPTIQSQQRLDWISSAVLEKYRRNSRNITISTQGLPQIQVNDPVGVKVTKLDLNSDLVSVFDKNNDEIYYVTQASSRLTRASYTSKLTLTSIKPIETWRPSYPINDYILTGLIYPRNNGSIFSNFVQETINSSDGSGYDCLSEQAAFVSFKSWIDVDRLWVIIQDDEEQSALSGIDGAGGLFKKINIKDNTPSFDYVILTDRAGVEFKEPKGGVWLHDGGGERWGKLTVPTLSNKFGNGQWIAQKSDSTARRDGIYPIAVWAQFRTSDGSLYKQGIWNPQLSDLNPNNISTGWEIYTSGDNIKYKYTDQNYANLDIMMPGTSYLTGMRMPGFRVSNNLMSMNMWVGSKASGIQIVTSGRLTDLSGLFDVHGYWNLPQLQSNCPTCHYDTGANQNKSFRLFVTGINRIELTEIVSGVGFMSGMTSGSSVRRLVAAADDGPFKNGDYVLVKGNVPGDPTPEWAGIFRTWPDPYKWGYANGTYGGDRADLRDKFNTMGAGGARWKAMQGWTPMAFNILTGYPTGIGFLAPRVLGATADITSISPSSIIFTTTKNHIYRTKFKAPDTMVVTGVSTTIGVTSSPPIQKQIRIGIYSGSGVTQTLLGETSLYNSDLYGSPYSNYEVNLSFPSGVPLTSGAIYSIALLSSGAIDLKVCNSAFFTTMDNSTKIVTSGATSVLHFPTTIATGSNGPLGYRAGYKLYASTSGALSGYSTYPGYPYTLKSPKTKLTYISDFNSGLFTSGSVGIADEIANTVSWGLVKNTSDSLPYFDGTKTAITSPFHDLNYYTVEFNTPVKYLRVHVYEFNLEWYQLNINGPLLVGWGGGYGVPNDWIGVDTHFIKVGYADMGTQVLQNIAIRFSDAATRGDITPASVKKLSGTTIVNSASSIMPVEFQSGVPMPVSLETSTLEVPTQWGASVKIDAMDLTDGSVCLPGTASNVRGPGKDSVWILIEFMQASTGQKYWTAMRGKRSDVGRIRFNPWAHSTLVR